MSQPASERSVEQVARGSAAAEVSDVLLNLERFRKRLTPDTYFASDVRLI